ncbi:hypothetical protein P7C70_g8011, partial [Phenoliferia sp. Uapishka_3]
MSPTENPITFSFFSSLVTAIRGVKARRKTDRAPSVDTATPAELKLLNAWITKLREVHNPLPSGTTVLFFRLLFPGEGVRRRYNIAEQTLCRYLERYFGTKRGAFDDWSKTTLDQRSGSSGCLGDQVEKWCETQVLNGRRKFPARKGELTLIEVDQYLDELASFSEYSAPEVRRLRPPKTRKVDDIIKSLLDPLTTSEIAIMIQIILRDLHPLLYPLPTLSGNKSLHEYNAMPYYEITLQRALKAWHEKMPFLYRLTADLDIVAREVEVPGWEANVFTRAPIIGVPVQVPKSLHPGSCGQATKDLRGEVAVETKYDGERIIRASLGLPLTFQESLSDHRLAGLVSSSPTVPTPHTRLILEGEMVSYNETDKRIDEFWTLASVKHGGIPTDYLAADVPTNSQDSTSTGHTNSPGGRGARRNLLDDAPSMHLMVVWFDVLLLDETSLVREKYQDRRKRLEKLVRVIPGYSMFAEAIVINFDDRANALRVGASKDQPRAEHSHRSSSFQDLRLQFSRIITNRGDATTEGLMLKPLDSGYNDWQKKWVKLKKDFIPGCGDTKDFFIVGARWEKDRGRKLNVPPSVFTTFFVGLLAEDLGANIGRDDKRHYHVLFSTSYGLDRVQLNDLCHRIREEKPQPFDFGLGSASNTFKACERPRTTLPVYASPCTTFTFSLAPHLSAKGLRPTLIFQTPRVVELTGAGFQKFPGEEFYALRWPRMTKASRTDGEPLSLSELQTTAEEAMKSEAPEAEDFIHQMWSAAGRRDAEECADNKRIREVGEWVEKLERADKAEGDIGSLLRSLRPLDISKMGRRPAPMTRLASVTNLRTSVAPNVNIAGPSTLVASSSAPAKANQSSPSIKRAGTDSTQSVEKKRKTDCPVIWIVDSDEEESRSPARPAPPSARLVLPNTSSRRYSAPNLITSRHDRSSPSPHPPSNP